LNDSEGRVGVLIVDDHPAVREGLRGIIGGFPGYRVVDTAESAEKAALILIETNGAPDVRIVVSDVSMKGRGGIDLVRFLKSARPEIACVMISVSLRFETIVEAVAAGARGYLGKDQGPDAILRCLDAVSRGEFGMEGEVLETVVKNAVRLAGSQSRLERPRYDGLTPREKDVFRLTALNRSAKDIAALLSVSEKTVENVRSAIMGKLETRDRFELYRYALKVGIIEE